MVRQPPKQFEYSWKNIAAMAAGLGIFAFVLAGFQADWKFGSIMGLIAALGALGFGAYMRRKQPQP